MRNLQTFGCLLLWVLLVSTPVQGAVPTFDNVASDGSTVVTVSEQTTTGSTVFILSATDSDVADTLTYSVSPSKFSISGATITLASALDYETVASYAVTVTVSDGTGNTATGTLTVSVINVNDETPTISAATYVASIAENEDPGTVVPFSLTFSDPDAADTTLGEKLSYSLQGIDSAAFVIDSSTGQITTARRLDRETKDTYDQLVIKVQDAASTPHTATASLTVRVTDVNDVTPSCSPAVYYVTVAENAAQGVSLTTLTCSDADSSLNGYNTIAYSIASGDPGSVFQLSGSQLQTGTTAIDYETDQLYSVVIHVKDSPASGTPNTGTVTVVVTVTGVNEFSPSWTTTPADQTIAEDWAIGDTLTTITASDSDRGSDGTVVYSITSVVNNNGVTVPGTFRLDSVSGVLSTLQSLDRDSGVTSYTIGVKAEDKGSPTRSITSSIIITLGDVNDNDPAFTSTGYLKTLGESSAIAGASLALVSATDLDQSPVFTYSVSFVLVGNPAGTFEFDTNTAGLFELAAAIDLDNHGYAYTLVRIVVTDGGTPTRTGTATVTVSVFPTNDYDPQFVTVPSGTVTVSESVSPGSLVATVSATDQDIGLDGLITLSITGGNTGNAFSIQTNGEIRTVAILDFDGGTDNYELVVTATDGGSPPRSASTTVSVAVSNVNDNAPDCTPTLMTVTLLESATISTVVASPSCSDGDGDSLAYSFTSGNSDSKFAISSTTGEITLANTVDYDSGTKSYLLQVSVSDGSHSQTLTVKIDVSPVNEATPSFTSNPTVTVSESEAAGYIIAIYTATDSDLSPHAITQYAITAVTQGGSSLFSIDRSSGIIKLLSPLDYDALPAGTKQYVLTVTATDGGGLVGTGTVTVEVSDVNDNAPSCSQSSWSSTILESVSSFPHTVINSLGCTDVEDGTSLTYTLTQSPGSIFSIANGGIQQDSAVDYESASLHILSVAVADSGNPPLSTTVIVNIIVQNVNEGPPVFGGPYSVSKAENVPVGTSVAHLVATDPDGSASPFGDPQYAIVSGDPSGQFSIDSSTGVVSTRAPLDAESVSTYDIVVVAVEKCGENSATATLTVSVIDVNDVTPSCGVSSFARTVSEPAAVGDAILTLACTDGDVTATTLTYVLASGDASVFAMASNALTLAAPLDYDAGPTRYDVTIRVSDSVSWVDVVGTVSVGAVNEFSPVFSQPTYTVSVSESLPVGGTAITVTATDGDSSSTPDGVVNYDLATASSTFKVVASSGTIVLSSSLDRELVSTYTLLVTARDSSTTATTTVSITITDVNDNAPVFTSALYTASVSETATPPVTVVTVSANDADDPGTNSNGVVRYSLTGGNTHGDFAIDSTTGVITTTSQLDAATASSYTLTVTAQDRNGASGALSSTSLVVVTVTAVNQHDPVFTSSAYTYTVNENTAVGTELVQVSATDSDSGSGGVVTYSMTSHAKFLLSADGWISIKAALDHETTPTSYTLDVIATDQGSPPRSATATISITVGDVNDNTALCTFSILSVHKREDAVGAVATLSCADADSGNNGALTYSIRSVNGAAGAGDFSVSAAGVVSVSQLDYETDASLEVVVVVSDGGLTPRSTSVLLVVTVVDVNENDPTFSGTPFSLNVAESRAAGTTLLTVTASGNDGSDTVTYSLSDTTYLAVDPVTGEVTLKAQLDYETTHSYSVDVCATDSNTVDARRTACDTFSISVTDANDNDPVFGPSVYYASIDENTIAGTTVARVTATDRDSLAAGGTISYSLVSGNTGNVFRVDATAGHVVIDDDTNLDYETVQSFSLVVRASDGGGRSSDAMVTVTVNPINEATPTFSPASSTVTLAEDAASGFSVATVTATDADRGADGQLTYSIAAGAFGKFGIDTASGEVTLVASLDRETTQRYALRVLAVDGGTTHPGPRTGTFSLTIDVTDVNDVAPTCTRTLYAASVAEDAATGASVKTLTCSDGDLDPANLNNAVTYAIAGGNGAGHFAVDAAGAVTVSAGSFDRETTSSYTLTLQVADMATSGRLTTTVTVSVDITDVNDNAPVFASDPYTPAAVPENSAVGHTVTTVSATDRDVGTNAAITYSLVSASVAGKFAVDAFTGVITVAGAVDYETTTAYTLVVSATDRGATPLSSSTTVSISISDVNDNPPVCASSVYTATLAEDADPATTTAVTVSCPDVDTPGITYSLTDAHFAVHPSTGVVSLTSGLDCETAQTHALTITASDGTYTATTVVEVTVTDVNEFAPVFAPVTPYTASVPENSAVGYTVKDVDASDADATGYVLTYSITSGNAGGRFTIDSATGVIQVLSSLDRETTPSYTLTLEAADGRGAGSRTGTTSIVIAITDVNDNDPACAPASYVASVDEDAALGTTVVTLTCSDADSSSPSLAFVLLAGGNSGSAFAVRASSGELTVAQALDYETLTAFALLVEVSDQGSPTARTTAVPVSIAVQPKNEFDPVFPAAGYGSTNVAESASVGTSVLTVTATDADVGLLQGTVHYSITSGNSLGHFAIDSASGRIKVAKALDRETTASYSLTIVAADDVTGSATSRSGTTTVPISVADVNDNYPVFSPTLYSVTVLESAPTGGAIATVTVTDDDAGTNAAITISILAGNTGSAFSIIGSDVILSRALDYETTSSYELVLQATDQGTPRLTAQAMVVVTVSAVNEQAPLLTDVAVPLNISEATPVGTLLYTANATDSDLGGSNDGTITYSIISGDSTPNAFYIGSVSGEVRVLSRLDYDTHPQAYNLSVEARDGGGLTDTLQLIISLLDENDHTPQFTRNTYTPTLQENVAIGASVATVTATDLDSGSNGQATYSITGYNGPSSFAIDPVTGRINTTASIDYESIPVMYLVVQAVDGGSVPLSSSCLVRITIVDLNDNPPLLVPDNFATTVSEDAAVGTQVAAVAATDADSSASNNNVVVFALNSTRFRVDPNTGYITTTASLDRETTPSYLLLVTATDQGTNPHQNTATATVTVSLIDVNDNTPIISGTYDLTVSEDTAVNTVIARIVARDADAGDNARLNYTITGGNTNSDFKIITSTGTIQVANALDRETTALYYLQVTVSDNGATSQHSISVTVTLTTSDVNDNDPVFAGTPYTFSVPENSNAGLSVGRLLATDADLGQNANLLYAVVSFWAGDSSHFALNAATGRITTAVRTLDRETQASYLAWCRVWDQGSPQRSADVNVSITITDVNDNLPVMAAVSYNASVWENSAVLTSVVTVSATDADAGLNAAITYRIDSSTTTGATASNYLQINNTSGEISVKRNIDYEADTSFVFVVVATDGGTPTFSSSATVTVRVVDVNDNAPAFTSTFVNTEVAYAGQCSSAVTTLTCTDADSGVNAQTLCYFSSNGYGSLFSVDGAACSVVLQSIAAAKTRYLVEVQCRDSGSTVKIAASPATVRIDTFVPDEVAIRFSLSISRSSFLTQESTFLTNIENLVKSEYPSAMVRLWCIQEREGTASSSSTGRRRLLADQPVDVLVYATQDSTTNSYANNGQTKAFVSSSQLMSIFALDATGTPSAAVSGSGLDSFGVQSVTEYRESNKPWIQTTEGIAVVTVCCAVALALLILTIVLCVRCCNRRKRPVTPVRALLAEPVSQAPRAKTSIERDEDSGWAQLREKPREKKSVPRAEVSADPLLLDSGRKRGDRGLTPDNLTSPSLDLASPRAVVLTSKYPVNSYPAVNRAFDGRALDPKTGRIYEYSTKTSERRWLEPPPAYQPNQ